MGEAAEMMLDGILDWDGSYPGPAISGHTRERRRSKADSPTNALHGVRMYLRGFKTLTDEQRSNKQIHTILEQYAQSINIPVAQLNESHKAWDEKLAWKLQDDFGGFVKWCSKNL